MGPRYKPGRDPGLRGCTWGGARIREFANSRTGGMKLYCHGGNTAFLLTPARRRPRKIDPAAPFCAIETNQVLRLLNPIFANLRCSGAAPGCFFFGLFCSAKHAKTQGKPRFCPNLLPAKKSTHRPPELIKFPMPAARHENKPNPAMSIARAPIQSRNFSCLMAPAGPWILEGGRWDFFFARTRHEI